MKRYHGGEKAPRGTYVNLATLEVVQSAGGTLVLAGGRDASYLKTPTPLLVLLGPIAGAAFIIFLPFTGIAGILGLAAYKLGLKAQAGTRRIFQTAAVSWRPGMAHLTKPVEKKGREAGEGDVHSLVDDLTKEIEERRKQGEQ